MSKLSADVWHRSHMPRASRLHPGLTYCLLCAETIAIHGQVTVPGDAPCAVKIRRAA